ncbi:MAG: hypothetical protein AB8B97_21750 [Granulosicoccus sp.]
MERLIDGAGTHRSARYLNIALAITVTIQIGLYLNRTGGQDFLNLGPVVVEVLYLVSLLLLVVVVFYRYILSSRITRQAELVQDQTDAMINMFTGVKHQLNNDMQVVLGNAELAEILVQNGGDLDRPVHNISAAATNAVQRIEQLSVFGSTGNTVTRPVDLNAMFRESMAKLADELPADVSLRMDLEHLSTQVEANRYLLSLSLVHLVRLAATSMRYGGQIVIQTSEYGELDQEASTPIVARMHIVRAASERTDKMELKPSMYGSGSNNLLSEDIDQFQRALRTTKALVERSGARDVNLSRRGDESLFSMGFAIETQSKPLPASLVVSQSFS